jgi:chloramphenicol 3-O phosphotransferase
MSPSVGMVVYLNGTAGSGKSTVARGLQERWPEPVLHVGLDFMTGAMPRRFLGHGADADLGARWVVGDDGRLVRIDAGPFGERLLRGIPRLAAALARAGNHVLVDDVLLYPWRLADVAAALTGVDAHLVEVRCRPDTAVKRLREREPDRPSGHTEAYYAATYENERYDLRLDTDAASSEACADALVRHLRSGVAPTALAAIRAATARHGA